MVDHHRPTTTKDAWGVWSGPFPVVRNDPDRGQVIVRVGNAMSSVSNQRNWLRQRCTTTVLTVVASLPAKRPAMTLGYVPTKKGMLQKTSASRLAPKGTLDLQYLIRNFFRIESVVSVRSATNIHKLPPVAYADSCTLVHYDNDVNP
eukprot:1752832-Pyramimonas_sp.AAC.1